MRKLLSLTALVTAAVMSVATSELPPTTTTTGASSAPTVVVIVQLTDSVELVATLPRMTVEVRLGDAPRGE